MMSGPIIDGAGESTAPDKNAFESALTGQLEIGKIVGLNLTLKDTISNLGGLTTALGVLARGTPAGKVLGPITTLFGTLGKIAGESAEKFLEIEDYAFKTFDQFGVGSENVDALKTSLYEAGQEMIEFTKGQMKPTEAFKAAADIQNQYSKSFARNVFIAKENIVEIQKASQLTNVASKTLIENFTAAGRSIYNLGDQMETVAKTIVGLGVNVAGVSDNVVKYIGKLDLYNFKNGVEGLSRMAAESARFGMSMEKTFALADDLMDPDKAIAFSNSLSQLGFASSELADPIRTLFLVENDPEEFNRQIMKLTESMFQFNETTGESVFVGNRRVVSELAKMTNRSAEEIMSQGKKLEEFNRVKEELKFTSFSEEDKRLIEGLAQFKPGKGFVVEFVDESGKKKEKVVTELSDKDITKLGEQYKIKSTDEALKKQLSSNDITNQLLFSVDASLLQLVVLQETGNKLSADFRKSAEEGEEIDQVKKQIRQNQTLIEMRKFNLLDEDNQKKIEDFKTEIITGEAEADDFIFRPGQKPLRFNAGDLVMGIKEEYIPPNFLNNVGEKPTESIETKLSGVNLETNNIVSNPQVSGEITLNVVVTSNTDMSKEKFENMLFDIGVVQNLQTKIKEAVSNFNLT